jgi:hypothetical protein
MVKQTGRVAAPAYVTLCERIEAEGGRIRLGRTGQAFMLVVDGPPGPARAAAYVFTDISRLNEHAALILRWLETER